MPTQMKIDFSLYVHPFLVFSEHLTFCIHTKWAFFFIFLSEEHFFTLHHTNGFFFLLLSKCFKDVFFFPSLSLYIIVTDF